MKLQRFSTCFALALAIFVLGFSTSVSAQKKPTTVKKPAVPPPTTSLDVKDAKLKVSNQIKNVSKFLYILGISSSGIEQADREAKAGKLSRTATEENSQNKQKILLSIRNLKAGLAELETSFRSKPALRNYLIQIQGITDFATESEDLATAGRFSESGRPFLAVIEKLTDALAAMPN